jgi:hypothetical protein
MRWIVPSVVPKARYAPVADIALQDKYEEVSS